MAPNPIIVGYVWNRSPENQGLSWGGGIMQVLDADGHGSQQIEDALAMAIKDNRGGLSAAYVARFEAKPIKKPR